MAIRKRKPVEANDGSYAGMVLGAFEAMPDRIAPPEHIMQVALKIAPDADLIDLALEAVAACVATLTKLDDQTSPKAVADTLAATMQKLFDDAARRGALEAMERSAQVCEKRAETVLPSARNEAVKCAASIRFCVGAAINPDSCPNCRGSKRILDGEFACPCAEIEPLAAIRARDVREVARA